jgi:hypothetical protein
VHWTHIYLCSARTRVGCEHVLRSSVESLRTASEVLQGEHGSGYTHSVQTSALCLTVSSTVFDYGETQDLSGAGPGRRNAVFAILSLEICRY